MQWKRAYNYHWQDGKLLVVSVRSLRHMHGWLRYKDADDTKDAKRYAGLMRRGTCFPPIEVYQTRRRKGVFFVSDGNHRLAAIRRLGIKQVPIVLFS